MPTLTLDLHTHLIEKGEKPERYWKAARAKKLDAVAITEHADRQPRKAYELLLERKPKGIALIPAMELNCAIGHVLAYARDEGIYSIKKLYKKNLPIGKALSIAESEGLLLSVSHPWGLSYDSAAYVLGEKRLARLVESEKIGVEAYNGMFGNVSSFFYSSSWIRKPMNFLDFLEKSRVGRKTRLSGIGRKMRGKLDKKGRELIERCAKPIELGTKARFITAGSDGHSAARIGTGIMKVNVRGTASNKALLQAVEQKSRVVWAGPYVRETRKGYAADAATLNKREFLQGIKYATKRAIVKGIGRRKKKKS